MEVIFRISILFKFSPALNLVHSEAKVGGDKEEEVTKYKTNRMKRNETKPDETKPQNQRQKKTKQRQTRRNKRKKQKKKQGSKQWVRRNTQKSVGWSRV